MKRLFDPAVLEMMDRPQPDSAELEPDLKRIRQLNRAVHLKGEFHSPPVDEQLPKIRRHANRSRGATKLAPPISYLLSPISHPPVLSATSPQAGGNAAG